MNSIAGSEKSKDSNTTKSEEIDAVYGKWKILKMVGEAYVYGDFSMEDYVGEIVTVHEDYIKTDLPLERWKLENVISKLESQNAEDFLCIEMQTFTIVSVLEANKLK